MLILLIMGVITLFAICEFLGPAVMFAFVIGMCIGSLIEIMDLNNHKMGQ